MKQIYTSLDIGSDSIKIVCAEAYHNRLNLLASTSIKAKGIKRGVITDPDLAKACIKEAFNQVEAMLGVKIHETIVTVPSYYADFILVKGEIDIERNADGGKGIITSNDILKAIRVSLHTKKPMNEVLTVLPIDFNVDGKIVRNPIKMEANNLASRSIMVTLPRKNILSVTSIVEMLGIKVTDATISGISNLYAYKTKFMDEHLGAIIDVGAETTTVSVYNKGIIVKTSVLQMGGKNVDNDLTYMYKVDGYEAKKIKEKFALAHKMYAQTNDIYTTKNLYNEEVKINQYEASEVVMSRLEEILTNAKNELNTLTSRAPEYILITGGMSNMINFNYIADDIFDKNVIIGSIKLIGIRDNKYAVALGSILYFIDELRLKGEEYSMLSSSDEEDLATVRKGNSQNSSMLEKVFTSFFGE